MKDTRAVQQIAQEQREHIVESGIVRTVRGRYIDVILDGTRKQVKDVILSEGIITIAPGWWVVMVRVPRSNHWIAISAMESIATGSISDTSNLPVPGSVSAVGKPYFIHLSWSGSFRDEATYEVQHNSSASETGATMIKVEGSSLLYWCAPGTQRYFRVRAVSSSYERSGWSAWVNATATTGSAYMFMGLDAAGTAPIWTAFNWTNVSGVAGAAMSHDHSTAAKGGTTLAGLTGISSAASTELTISGGAVTRTQLRHTIDTEGDAGTDDLDTINDGTDGMLLLIRAEHDARTVVVKHNTGNIWLSGKADISLDDAGDALILIYVNAISKWVDLGWSAVGAGGGGAPTDAQYLVLALDDTLTDERRFVDGDGLQAVDGGAGGDYTLNIDVSDFAGTGLEDDGAENLRIAAAAAGDGLQGGGGDPLAVDATVVRTSGDQTVGGIKTFTGNLVLDDGASDSPAVQWVGGSQDDTISIFLDDDPDVGKSDLVIRLAGSAGQSKIVIQNAVSAAMLTISDGGAIAGTSGGWNTGSGNLTTGGNLYVTTGHATIGGGATIYTTPADDDAVDEVLALVVSPQGGTGAAGLGGRLLYGLLDDGGAEEDAAAIDACWSDASAASEDSYLAFSVRVGGAALAEMCRIDGAGLVMATGKSITMKDDSWIGLGSNVGRIVFDDQADDEIEFLNCHVGIGASPTSSNHLYVADSALDTTVAYVGIHSAHVKTAGATDRDDHLYGMYSYFVVNDTGAVQGHLYGLYAYAGLTDGNLGDAVGPRGMYCIRSNAVVTGGRSYSDVNGIYSWVDIDAGQVDGSVYGSVVNMDIEATATIAGNVIGQMIYLDTAEDPTGNVVMLYLVEGAGVNFCIYQAGSAPSYFGGSVYPINNKTQDLGHASLRWATIYSANALSTGTSRLLDSAKQCPLCSAPMKASTGGLLMTGEDADYNLVFCPMCGVTAVEELRHRQAKSIKKAPKIQFEGFTVVAGSGNSRRVRVDFRYSDPVKTATLDPANEGKINSTFLSDAELATLLALRDDNDRAGFLLSLGQREWEALEEIRMMEQENTTLQSQLDAAVSGLIGTDLAT